MFGVEGSVESKCRATDIFQPSAQGRVLVFACGLAATSRPKHGSQRLPDQLRHAMEGFEPPKYTGELSHAQGQASCSHALVDAKVTGYLWPLELLQLREQTCKTLKGIPLTTPI